MSQYLALAVCIVATALAGCSAGTVSTSVGPGHPANANAAQSIFELTPTRSPEPVTSTTDADSPHHAVPPAGDAAESGLGRLMNSYLAIGAALVSMLVHGPEGLDEAWVDRTTAVLLHGISPAAGGPPVR